MELSDSIDYVEVTIPDSLVPIGTGAGTRARVGALPREPTSSAAEENEQNQSSGWAAVAMCKFHAP